jgi:hypothetical protein
MYVGGNTLDGAVKGWNVNEKHVPFIVLWHAKCLVVAIFAAALLLIDKAAMANTSQPFLECLSLIGSTGDAVDWVTIRC